MEKEIFCAKKRNKQKVKVKKCEITSSTTAKEVGGGGGGDIMQAVEVVK